MAFTIYQKNGTWIRWNVALYTAAFQNVVAEFYALLDTWGQVKRNLCFQIWYFFNIHNMPMRHIIKYSLAWGGNNAFIRRSFGWHVKLFLFESKVKILENSYNSMCYDYNTKITIGLVISMLMFKWILYSIYDIDYILFEHYVSVRVYQP